MSKPTFTLPAVLVLALLGCDEAKPVEATQVEVENTASLQANSQVTIAAKDLELAAVVEVIEREDVRDAESLEALINADDSTIDVDIDKDGKRDFISVHEVEIEGQARIAADAEVEAQIEDDGALTITGADGQKVRFELRAIPSSKVTVEADAEVLATAEVETVVVATVDVELHTEQREVVVEARYAPEVVVVADVEVEHTYVHRIELEHRHDHLVVVGAPFIAWVWIDVRPVYVGHVHLPPGHAKKLGLHWHHHDHGHPRHHGHGHGGPDKVHVKVHGGGPDKVHVKVKGGGGPDKVHVKSKGGGGKPKGGKGKR
jgi:hypothetical protein